MKLPWYLKQVDKPYEDENGWHIEIKFTWLGWLWFKWKLKRIPDGEMHIDITTKDDKRST